MDTPLYVCPRDRQPLEPAPQALLCPLCQTRYPVEPDGVALLDVNLNPEAAAFDEQHQEGETLTDQAKQESLQQTARFLDALGGAGFELHGKTLLDVGCGHGALTYGLAFGPRVSNSQVYAFDHSTLSLKVLTQSLANETSSNQVFLSSQDVYAMAYADEFFDLIFGNAVLHHFLDIENVLASCHRMLKPGGTAIFAEPFAHG